jgi:hypothetical protein
MAASLHLAHYAPRQTGRMLRAMARHRGALERTPGLAVARLCFTAEMDTLTGGRPTPTRWGLLCGWDSADARDGFLADGAGLETFLSGARESWTVSLDTVRVVQGEWRGWQPSTEGVERLHRDEPVAVITYGIIRARYLPAFTWNNRNVVRELAPNPGHVLRVGLADHPMARCTFSLWRSQGDVVRFAYGPGGHNPVQRRSLDVPWGHEFFFARFRPVASSGTWMGRDPLADLHRQAQPAAA